MRCRVSKVRGGTVVREDFLDEVGEVELASCVVAKSNVGAILQKMFHVVNVTSWWAHSTRLLAIPNIIYTQLVVVIVVAHVIPDIIYIQLPYSYISTSYVATKATYRVAQNIGTIFSVCLNFTKY